MLHRNIRPSHQSYNNPSLSPTIRKSHDPLLFRIRWSSFQLPWNGYDETDKWLSLHILQVMAVPTRSHLSSLEGFKQILWRFKGPHAGCVPSKGGHTRHHCINCMGYKRKDGRNFMRTTTLHSRQGSTIRGTYPPSLIWFNGMIKQGVNLCTHTYTAHVYNFRCF